MSGKYARDPAYGKPPNWNAIYREHFPHNTDPWSRHARMIASEILRDPKSPVRRLLIDAGYEPDHWASAIEVTVRNLWEARVHLEWRELPKRGGKIRAARNRDMWKAQCERQAEALAAKFAVTDEMEKAGVQQALHDSVHGSNGGWPGYVRRLWGAMNMARIQQAEQ